MNRPAWTNLMQIILLSAVIGGTAGILTSAATNDYLAEYSLQLAEITEPLRLSEERPRNFPKSFAEAVDGVKTKASPGVVEFYLKRTGQASYDTVGDPAMGGLVLTSDGWLVTYPTAGQSVRATHVVVQGQSFLAQKIITDPTTGAVFVKIEAQNLPVVAFGDGFALEPGEQIFLLPGAQAVQASRLVALDRGANLQQKSDIPTRRLILDAAGPVALPGAPATNLAGEFIGLVDSEHNVLPANIILPAFTSLLHEDEIIRASLGVKYVDLSHAVGLNPEVRRGHEHGALLWENLYAPVPYGSAGAQAGLQANDIILAVDGQTINNQRSLAEYLLDYQSGDTVVLQIDRAGQTSDIDVTLL